jgi:hypothetical protein
MNQVNVDNDKIDSWTEWFQSRESGKEIDMSNQETLFNTFNSTVSKSNCIEAVVNHDETAFLHTASFGRGNVAVFHHLTVVGQNIYNRNGTIEYGFIQGLGKDTAISMTPDIDTLFSEPNGAAVPVPSPTALLSVSSSEEVDALTDSATVVYKARNLIPIPQFLIETIQNSISKSNGNSKLLLIECVKKIKEFDIEHANDVNYSDKARSKSKDILLWLYLVNKGSNEIDAVPVIGCNEKVAKALSKVKQRCLKTTNKNNDTNNISAQVEQSLKRPFEVLATSASSTSDFMEKLTQLQNQSSEKSTKSFKKIPVKYQNMILVASSIGEVTAPDYDADATEFFKCPNNLNAQVMLNSLLEAEGIECSVSAAVTTSLLFGSFLWKNSLSPSGLAASVISSEGIFRTDTLHEGMILDYATRFDMSVTSLAKLTKTQVAFPIDIEDLTHRLRALLTLVQFFFKRNGYLSQGLQKFVNFCCSNRMLLRTRIHLDNQFIAKIICATDERIYLWLKQCSSATSVTDTDLSLIDFTQSIQDIQLNRFNYTLPPCVTKISKTSEKDEAGTPQKKKKFESERNTNMNKEWKLRPAESWEAIFMNKTNDSPMLSMDCRACLKYQVKGICYSDCRHRASHTILKNEDKEKLDKFIKELRGE